MSAPQNSHFSKIPFTLRLELGNGISPFMQIVQQVERAILLGQLQAGDRLPTIRDVVEEIVVNPNTVQKAYKTLEGRGLVTGRQGQGVFVLETSGGAENTGVAILAEHLEREWFPLASKLNVDAETIKAIFDTALTQWLSKSSKARSRKASGEIR